MLLPLPFGHSQSTSTLDFCPLPPKHLAKHLRSALRLFHTWVNIPQNPRIAGQGTYHYMHHRSTDLATNESCSTSTLHMHRR